MLSLNVTKIKMESFVRQVEILFDEFPASLFNVYIFENFVLI